MRDIVNRHQRTTYNQIRIEGLSESVAEADRIACMVLAVAYSRAYGDTPSVQKLIQMDCVAACFVNRDIWLASNQVGITEEDINNALGDEYNGTTVWVVENGNGRMHAEMQLVQELQHGGYPCRGRYIGVSKPCCDQCAAVLDNLGMNYLHRHKDKVKRWESPQISGDTF